MIGVDGPWTELYFEVFVSDPKYLNTIFLQWERENGRLPWPSGGIA